MLQEFSINKKNIILNFSKKYCTTSDEIFDSECYKKVILLFLEKKEKINADMYKYLRKCFGNSNEEILANVTLFLKSVCDKSTTLVILREKDKTGIFEDLNVFLSFVWDVYDFWRSFERYSIYSSDRNESIVFEQMTNLTQLILKSYRKIREKLSETKNKIYRQLNAGANVGLLLSNNEVKNIYKELDGIPFIKTILLQPPFFITNKGKMILNNFNEVNENPISKLNLNKEEWFCLSLKISNKLIFAYFHIDFMANGITLSNIFEIADSSEYETKKPDLILIFGVKDKNSNIETIFYQDKENSTIVGYVNYHEAIDYFGYIKRMILTIFNIQILDEGRLPVNGCLLNIVLQNNKTTNVVMVGDSSSGKHETIRALEILTKGYVKEIKTIFTDIGYLHIKDNVVYASGTETGIFTKFTELSGSDTYKTIDRGIFINLQDDNDIRVATNLNNFNVTNLPYKVDYFMYLNNYEEGMEYTPLSNVDEATKVFIEGKRVVKVDNTKIEEKILFSNKYGAIQREEETKKSVIKYIKTMLSTNVAVGEVRTGVSLRGYADKGPLLVAKKIFDLIVYGKN
jgi:hypothetical protein